LDSPICNYLLVEFDHGNRVRRCEFTRAPPFKRAQTFVQQLRKEWGTWAAGSEPPN
jgi:hypothetical protein